MTSKLRPNVLILGLAMTILVGLFGHWITSAMNVAVAPEILTMLVGIGIGPLIAIVAMLATDSPPPSVPADVHVSLVLQRAGAPYSAPASVWQDKLKPNVLILGILFAVVTVVFAYWLIHELAGTNVTTQILALVVGSGLSGLATVIGQVAADPPPPTVPADVHERLVTNAINPKTDAAG